MTKDQALKGAQENANAMKKPMVVAQSYRPGGTWVVLRKDWLDSWDGKNQAKVLIDGQVVVWPAGHPMPAVSDKNKVKPHWSGR